MIITQSQYRISLINSFECLSKDFLKLCEYIDPIDANKNCFSLRTFELLLRTCTEIENLWSIILRDKGHSGKNWNINEYYKIESDYGLNLSSKEVTFVYWKPDSSQSYIKPFENWTTDVQNSPRLNWYKAYNNVKHDRELNFPEASLNNVRYALSALYVNLVEYFSYDIFTPSLHADPDRHDKFRLSSIAYRDHVFQIKQGS
jgi:hypothetical protein